MSFRVLFVLLAVGMFGPILPAYADFSPATDDLWDASRGTEIIAHTPRHSISDIRNMFGYSHSIGNPAHLNNAIFQDRFPQGRVHSVEWVTENPIELSRFVLYAEHSANQFAANHRGFSEFRFYTQSADGSFVLQDSMNPDNPYGGGTEGNELTYEKTFETPIISQRFKAEFVQYGPSSTSSGPLVVELDGFGTELSVLPAPAYDDLFDVSSGITVTNDSGVLMRQGNADIRDMFGGEFGGLFPLLDEKGKMIFDDELPAGTTHFVEWQTVEPIILERIHLFAAHGDVDHQGNTVDANARGFTRFALFAKNETGTFEKIYEYFPANPYGGGGPPAFHELTIAADIDSVYAQEFRAEFDQWGSPSTHSGPRIIELDGFGTVEPAEPVPIVIVPGLLASVNPLTTFANKPGTYWTFVPGARGVYRSLLQRLESSGFAESEKVFVAHYDWRRPISETSVQYLKPTINHAKEATGAQKVDIVAHSMGGLLAREYIQSPGYQGDIDQLIMLGTPHEGSADAYVAWEGGDFPITWSSGIKFYVDQISQSLNRVTNQSLEAPVSFRNYFPSLQNVMPIFNFVTRNGSDIPVNELTAQNTFLQQLKIDIADIEGQGVNVTAIVGTDVDTLATIPITDERTKEDEILERWRDGHPNPEILEPDSTAGDQRVLTTSATLGENIIQLEGVSHEELPEAAQEEILAALGIEVQGIHIEPPDIKNLFGVVVLSPIDPVITCGEYVLSKDENTFNEAQYIADPDHPDGPKILTIGNPPAEECTVELNGTGSGEYGVVTTYADDDETRSFTMQGTTRRGQQESFSLQLTEEGFHGDPKNVADTFDNLRNEIRDLFLHGRHLNTRVFTRLFSQASQMYGFSRSYSALDDALGFDHRVTQKQLSRVEDIYQQFLKEFEKQVEKGNADEVAVSAIRQYLDQLQGLGFGE